MRDNYSRVITPDYTNACLQPAQIIPASGDITHHACLRSQNEDQIRVMKHQRKHPIYISSKARKRRRIQLNSSSAEFNGCEIKTRWILACLLWDYSLLLKIIRVISLNYRHLSNWELKPTKSYMATDQGKLL